MDYADQPVRGGTRDHFLSLLKPISSETKILCTMSAAHGALAHCYRYFSNRLDFSTEIRWTHVMSSNKYKKIHFINKLSSSFKSIYNISSFIAPMPPKHQRKPLLCLSALRLHFQRLHKMIFLLLLLFFAQDLRFWLFASFWGDNRPALEGLLPYVIEQLLSCVPNWPRAEKITSAPSQ